MIGVVGSDSTIVYYSLTDALVDPESVDDQSPAKLKQQRKAHRPSQTTDNAVTRFTTTVEILSEIKSAMSD